MQQQEKMTEETYKMIIMTDHIKTIMRHAFITSVELKLPLKYTMEIDKESENFEAYRLGKSSLGEEIWSTHKVEK